MALFNDGPISTPEELRAYESAIYDVASTERIDLSQKLVLAQTELEIELTSRVLRENPEDLKRVVVTPPLHSWHTFHALALVYRDAYNNQFNDRYQAKWREYEQLSKWAYRNLAETGIGMVSVAIPKATPPALSTTAGSAQAGMYWVRAAWVGASGEEGCPSEPSVLSAPQNTVPVAEAGLPPAAVPGWNIYAGTSVEDTRLQNLSPMPIGVNWVMPSSGLVAGRAAGKGQSPSVYRRIERVLQRG